MQFVRRHQLWALAALTAWTHAAQGQAYDPDWARNFRVGMLVGFNINADFKMSGSAFPISGSNPGPIGQRGKDHFYDDGYVRVDSTGNGNPDSVDAAANGGFTTYWSYQNSSQISGQTLQFHSSSTFATSAPNAQRDDTPYVGFELAYGGNLGYWRQFRFGWEVGFGLLPISITDSRPLSASVVQSTYSFKIPSAVTVVPGPPPYYGPYNGNSGAASIYDIATLAGSTNLANQPLTGSRTLDVNLYAFRLGPSVFWDVSPYIGISASAGPALGIVSGDYKYDETIVTPNGPVRNKGRFDDTEIVYGGYVSATVTYHAVEKGDIYLGAQFMPLGDATFSKGGRSAKLNLGGAVFISAGINWPF